jgi:hypothetical protein
MNDSMNAFKCFRKLSRDNVRDYNDFKLVAKVGVRSLEGCNFRFTCRPKDASAIAYLLQEKVDLRSDTIPSGQKLLDNM